MNTIEEIGNWTDKKVRISLKDTDDAWEGILEAVDNAGIMLSGYVGDDEETTYLDEDELADALSDGDTYFQEKTWIPWAKIEMVRCNIKELTYKEK